MVVVVVVVVGSAVVVVVGSSVVVVVVVVVVGSVVGASVVVVVVTASVVVSAVVVVVVVAGDEVVVDVVSPTSVPSCSAESMDVEFSSRLRNAIPSVLLARDSSVGMSPLYGGSAVMSIAVEMSPDDSITS